MRRQVLSVQVLRALAAVMVILGHVQAQAIVDPEKYGGTFTPSHLLPWGAGVDLFFVISGFIMVISSEKLFTTPRGSLTFMARRLARIVPLYWAFSSLYLLTRLYSSVSEGKVLPAWSDILASYLFWPTDTFADGHPRPFYTLGWTLNYEMFFYCLFALFLMFPREKAVGYVVAALSAGVVLGLATSPAYVPFQVWSQPIVLEFALGMGIALLYRRGIEMSRPIRLALCAGGVLALGWDAMDAAEQAVEWITPNDLHRALGWGLPAAVLLAAAVLKPHREHEPGRIEKGAAMLGDASYALYLVHPFVIVGLNKLWVSSKLQLSLGYWPFIAAVVVMACVASLLVHRWFEVPATRLLQVKKPVAKSPQLVSPPHAAIVATPLPERGAP